MRLYLVLILMCLFSAGSSGQKQYKYFYGKVLDRTTSEPLPGVNIRFTGTSQGCVTNEKGEFSVFLDTIPVYMIVSYVSFETRKIWLDGSSASLTILLNPAVTTLPEVEVVGKPGPQSFYKDRQYSVLDFKVRDSLVWVLVYRFTFSVSEILCFDLTGAQLASSGTLPFRPDSLFRDCLDNIHIMGSDSAYQVFLDSSRIELIYPVSMERFDKVLQNCVGATSNTLFYKEVVSHGLGINFYGIDRKHGKKQLIATEEDSRKMKMLNENKDDLSRLSSQEIPDDRQAFDDWNFARKVLYKPITASLYQVGEYVCIFNTAEKTIEFYTLGGDYSFKVKLGVDEVRQGRWTREIYLDDQTQKVYTSFVRNGRYFLYRVDLNTGDLRQVMTIAHEFPEKITIHGGNLLYMYTIHGKGGNKEMFRQRIL
jgi:hypothetical protein